MRKKNNSFFFYMIEIILFCALLFAITRVLSAGNTADFDIRTAASEMIQVMDSDALQEENALKIRDRFGLSDSDYSEAVYYGPVSNMDVEELLILKLNAGADSETIESDLEARVAYQETNFDGYGTDQMGLLDNAQILVQGDYAVLIISEHADEAFSLYREYLKGGR